MAGCTHLGQLLVQLLGELPQLEGLRLGVPELLPVLLQLALRLLQLERPRPVGILREM
jgi:hypothetical protein